MRKAAFFLALAAVSGCAAVDRAAVRSAAALLESGRAGALEEPDFELARDAAPAQLKLIETLLASSPEDRGLRRLAAEGFGGGAFVFLEETQPGRAKGWYVRGRDHALAALALKEPFRGLAAKGPDAFAAALARAGKDDVTDLFWAGFCWGGYINLSKDDAAALADLPKAVALMERSRQLDPAFHFGGADLFFGIYYASRPPILGGSPARAKAHFEAAHLVTKGDYLMTHVLRARWYAVAVQDRALYSQLLSKVLDSPSGRLPEARLTDEAAKRQAKRLLEKIDDYF